MTQALTLSESRRSTRVVTDGGFYGKYLAAFASGLSAEEQMRLEYAPNVRAGVRAKLEDALVKAGVKRR